MSSASLKEITTAIGGVPYDFRVLPFASESDYRAKETFSGDGALLEAVKLAGELLVNNPFSSGSMVTHVGNPEARVGEKSELLHSLQSILTEEIDPRHALIDESKTFGGVSLNFKTALGFHRNLGLWLYLSRFIRPTPKYSNQYFVYG